MTRSAVLVAGMTLLCLSAASDVQAEPITITGGLLVFPMAGRFQAGPISLVGTRGFSVEGRVDGGESLIGPLECIPCIPGSTLDLGLDLGGPSWAADTVVTLDGETFTNIGSASSLANLFLHSDDKTTVPELQNSPVVVTAPFTVTGVFFCLISFTSFTNCVPSMSGKV